MTLQVRPVRDDEQQQQMERLTRGQTGPVRLARRARSSALAATSLSVPALAVQGPQSSQACGRCWIERFTATGRAGLDDAPRAGRPRTSPEDASRRVMAKARGRPPKPEDGEVPPTCHWPLDRLQIALATEGRSIQRRPIRRSLKTEHRKWQQPRTGLASPDPDCADKRGASSASRAIRHPAAR